MKKKKVLIPLLLLAIAAGAAKFVLAEPTDDGHHKISGPPYVLPKEFLTNLSDGRYVKLSVALILDPLQSTGADGHGAAAAQSSNFGTLEQEPVIRDIVIDTVTSRSGDELVGAQGRAALKEALLAAIRERTDVRVREVLFTDFAVQ